MQKQKVTIEVDIDDERVNCIEDIEREILAQNIHKQVAIKYLESLQTDRSQQVDVREALRESEEHYHTLFNQVPDIVYAIEQETGRVLDVNEAACRIYGYTREEWLKMKNTDVSAQPDETSKATKEPPNIIPVRYHRKKDGTVFPLEMTLNTFNLNGRKTIIVIAKDITERKTVEEALKESEERYRRLVKFSPYGIAIHSEGKLVYLNLAGAKILGTENPDEIVGKMLLQIVHPDYHEIAKKRIRMQEEGKVVPPLEEKFLRLDGIPVDVEVVAIPFTYMGKLAMYRVFRDITENKLAEMELIKYRDQLEEMVKERTAELHKEINERRLIGDKLREVSVYTRSLFEANLDPLVTISLEGKITDMNKATELVTGISCEKLIGSDFSDYFTEPEKAKEVYHQVFEKGFVRDYPLTIRHTSGRIIDVLYNVTVYKTKAGVVQGVFAAARDITENRILKQELNKSNKQQKLLCHLIQGTRGGKTRALILKHLFNKSYNTNQLATALNMDYKTIRHHLAVLIKNGIIGKVNEMSSESYFILNNIDMNFDGSNPPFE